MGILFLAFANSPTNPLPYLLEEDKEVFESLSKRHSKSHFKIVRESHATADSLKKYLVLYRHQITVFLYSGHAGPESISLDDEKVFVKGLAGLLSQCSKLRLAIFNGCKTQGIVKLLVSEKTTKKENIPVVIVTKYSVYDDAAKNFSVGFFQNFSKEKATIREAFETGFNFALTVKNKPTTDIRGFVIKSSREIEERDWTIYYEKDMDNWALPDTSYSSYKTSELLSISGKAVVRIGGGKDDDYEGVGTFTTTNRLITSSHIFDSFFQNEEEEVIEVKLYATGTATTDSKLGVVDKKNYYPKQGIAFVDVNPDDFPIQEILNSLNGDPEPTAVDRFFLLGLTQKDRASMVVDVGYSPEKPRQNNRVFVFSNGKKNTSNFKVGAPVISHKDGEIYGILGNELKDGKGYLSVISLFDANTNNNQIAQKAKTPGDGSSIKEVLRRKKVEDYLMRKEKIQDFEDAIDHFLGNPIKEYKKINRKTLVEDLVYVLKKKPFVQTHDNFLEKLLRWLNKEQFPHFIGQKQHYLSKLLFLFFALHFLDEKSEGTVHAGVFKNSIRTISSELTSCFGFDLVSRQNSLKGLVFNLLKFQEEFYDNQYQFDPILYWFPFIYGGRSLTEDLHNFNYDSSYSNWIDSTIDELDRQNSSVAAQLRDYIDSFNEKSYSELKLLEDKVIAGVKKSLFRLEDLEKQFKGQKSFRWDEGEIFIRILALIMKSETKEKNYGYQSTYEAAFHFMLLEKNLYHGRNAS